ncbi:M23 family metallopeptidase [Roseibium litorale]|uniref:M23 family metallopeptidase n=1 Tax=Roseibium litorale TaxID=2803841 RepID=A0ABR9CVV2_9HYPH|nr:M23 family metallopeptidase [Roseibium litorale]MBD8894221.1 M23 family metallopeptidase [Roseibium litorale]
MERSHHAFAKPVPASPGTLFRKRKFLLAAAAAFALLGTIGASSSLWYQSVVEAESNRIGLLQHSYQDRIDRLRAEIDRLNSRQALDRETVELRVGDLIRRQQALSKRHEIVSRLIQQAENNGILMPDTSILPSPKPLIALQDEGSDFLKEEGPAIGGEAELVDDPMTALGLRGSSALSGTPAGAARQAEQPDTVRSDKQAALGKVEDDITAMDAESAVVLTALTRATRKQIDGILKETRPLGVGFAAAVAPATSAAPAADVGGPFVPYEDEAFFNRVETAEKSLSQLTRLKNAARRLPIARPLESEQISSDFGPRLDPFLSRIAMHTGMDFKAPYGTRVYATAPGTVIKARYNGGYGKMVEIRHSNGLVTRYGHLSQFLVLEGDHVTTGDVIGNVGSTGRSTGPHLHYEVRVDDNAVDPEPFVRAGERLAAYL